MIKNRKGLVLIAAYLVIGVLLILGAAYISRSISEMRIAERERDSIAVFYAAEAGIDYGLEWLRSQSAPPSGTAQISLPAGPAIETGTYSVAIDPDDNNPATYLKRYRIISTAQKGNTTRILIYEVQVDSYARYAYFTDTEHFRWYGWYRVPVWFVTGDSLSGPTHTNSHFHISGNPVFADTVSSVDDFITYMHGGPPNDNPSFIPGQPQLGVEPINMPSKALYLRTAAVQEGLRLTGPTTITFKSDGTMDVTNSNNGWVNQNVPLPANGALFVTGGDLNISGTLNGQLSVGTNRNVVITNDITYNTDPRVNPNSTDMLGIIAERDVIVSQDAPYDLTIQASIMALDDSFYVDKWSSPPAKGTLTIYGGLIQDERGPVGTFNPSTNTRVSGYSKSYIYDPRLRLTPPPFYPATGDYIGISWREQ